MKRDRITWRGQPRLFMKLLTMIKNHGDSDACLEWPHSRRQDGYGELYYRGSRWRTHRLAFKLVNGRIYRSLQVIHSCDNPPCFNPKHISQGTQKDNVRDMWARNRRGDVQYAKGPRGPNPGITGEKHGNAKLTNEIALSIRARYAAGETQPAIAADLDIHNTTVSRVVNRLSWKHI